MAMKSFVNQSPPATLRRDTWRHAADRIFPAGRAPPIPGGAVQPYFSWGHRRRRWPARGEFRTRKALSLLFHGPHCRGSAWCPALSTTWERPPAARVFRTCWYSHLCRVTLRLSHREVESPAFYWGERAALSPEQSGLENPDAGRGGAKVAPGRGDTNGKGRGEGRRTSATRVVGGARKPLEGVAAL